MFKNFYFANQKKIKKKSKKNQKKIKKKSKKNQKKIKKKSKNIIFIRIYCIIFIFYIEIEQLKFNKYF
jgi:hypothetical protein